MSTVPNVPSYTGQRIDSVPALSLDGGLPFTALVIEGIPWIFTDTVDARLTASNLGSGYSAYTLKPYLISPSFTAKEVIDFFNFSTPKPSSINLTIQDNANSIGPIFSQLTSSATKTTAAITSTSALTVAVASTSQVTTTAGTPIYLGRETIIFSNTTSTSFTHSSAGSMRGQFGSTAALHAAGAMVSLYPRFWQSRTATLLLGDLSAPAGAQALWRGVVMGVEESQIGTFKITLDDVKRLAGKPCFDGMAATAMHIGEYQSTVYIPYGASIPKDPAEFQTTYVGGSFGVFPQQISGQNRGHLLLDAGDKSDYFGYSNFRGDAVGSGSIASLALQAVRNGDFSDWDTEDLGTTNVMVDVTDYDRALLEAAVNHEDVKLKFEERAVPMRRYTPRGWTVNGGTYIDMGGINEGGPLPAAPKDSCIIPEAGFFPSSSYSDSVHASAGTSARFNIGAVKPLWMNQELPFFDSTDFDLIFNDFGVTTGVSFYVELYDTGGIAECYYDFASDTWTATPSQLTVSSTLNTWTRNSQTISMDKARTLRLRIGNVSAAGTLSSQSDVAFLIGGIETHLAGKWNYTSWAASGPTTGPAIITFYNCFKQNILNTLPTNQLLSGEQTINWSNNPKMKEAIRLKGDPIQCAKVMLMSIDGNATTPQDLLPASFSAALTTDQVDVDSFDRQGRAGYMQPVDMFITGPYQPAEYIQKNILAPNLIYMVSRNNKLSCVRFDMGLQEWVASQTGAGSFAPTATWSSDMAFVGSTLTYSDGHENISNRVTFNVRKQSVYGNVGSAGVDESGRINLGASNAKAVVVINDAGDSKAYYGPGRNGLTIDSEVVGVDNNYMPFVVIAQQWFIRFAKGKPQYVFRTDWSPSLRVFVGDVIAMTASQSFDSKLATRGLSSTSLFVHEKILNYAARTIDWVASPRPADQNPGYYAPCLDLTTAGQTVTYTVAANTFSLTADMFGGVNKDINAFPASGYCTWWRPSVGTPYLTAYTISAAQYGTNNITFVSGAPPTSAVGDRISFGVWAQYAAGASELNRVFFATDVTDTIATSTGTPYTYA